MDNLKFAMIKSLEYMNEEIKLVLNGVVYSEKERQRLFYACGTCLHWILDFAERVEVSEENKRYISAFRFANNALKHDRNLFELTKQTGGFEFPIQFPIEIEEKEIRWKELEDSGKFKAQHENYIVYLQGKSVVESCKIAINMLLNV